MAQKYSDLYQNWCGELPLTWNKVLEIVQHPTEHTDKGSIPLWSFYHFVEKPVMTWAGEKAIGRNMEAIYALIVDYDNGTVQMEDLDSLIPYKHVAYSSPSNSLEVTKFRVIVPLDKPLDNKFMRCQKVRKYLCGIFGDCDPSTFDYFRRQRMPSKLPKTLYHTSVRGGNNMALDVPKIASIYDAWLVEHQVAMETALASRKTKKSVFNKTVQDLNAENYIDSLKEKFKYELGGLNMTDRGHGIVHDTLRRIVYSMRKSYIDEDEIWDFMDAHTPMGMSAEIESLIFGEIYD